MYSPFCNHDDCSCLVEFFMPLPILQTKEQEYYWQN
jgi:hypothetical protein